MFKHKAHSSTKTGVGGTRRMFFLSDAILPELISTQILQAQETAARNTDDIINIARSHMQRPITISHAKEGKKPCTLYKFKSDGLIHIEVGFALIEPKVRELIAAEDYNGAYNTLIKTLYEPETRTCKNGDIHANGFWLTPGVARSAVALVNEIFTKGKEKGMEFTKEEVCDAVRMKFATTTTYHGRFSFTPAQISHELAENPMPFLVSFPGKPPQKAI